MTNITKAQAAKAQAVLDKQIRVNGKEIMTRRALIERCVSNGYTLSEKYGKRVLISPDGTWFDREAITTTGLNYAKELLKRS